jgi:predicted lysophospholipase L1 biosynthesis ABC-type transport system permease subunit
MNFRILFKSFKFAFRSRKRVLSFIVVYAFLFVTVARGLETPSWYLYLAMALVVGTFYAIIISQFRRRDISIFKCIGWDNSNVMLLLVGEVVLVSLSAFLILFQLSIEIIGLTAYLGGLGSDLLASLHSAMVIDVVPLVTTLLWIVVLQIPGLLLAQYRATRIPPMRALREE